MHELALFDGEDVQLFVIAGTDGELDVALVAELELGNLAAALFVVERHQVILAELRRGREFKALAEHGGREDGAVIALRERRVDADRGNDGRHESLAVTPADHLVYTPLDGVLREERAESPGLAALGALGDAIIYCHFESASLFSGPGIRRGRILCRCP